MWIRRDEAFPPVISPELFAKAQEVMRERRRRRTDQEAIDRLAALSREKGRLTTAIIDAANDMLSAEAYRDRFGSLATAYELAGYQPEPRYRRAETRARYRTVLSQIAEEAGARINGLGGQAVVNPESSLICISQGCRVSLNAARAVSNGGGRIRWQISASSNAETDLTLIARLDASNEKVVAYYLLPTPALTQSALSPVRLSNKVLRQACRFEGLDEFCRLCVGLGGVA
jgi:hypothetical protein